MPDRFHGIFTPLVTPITPDEALDTVSLRRLVESQVAGGVHGLWAMGTSAEFAAFDESERAEAVRATVEAAGGKLPVIANISDAATRLAIRHARRAREAGADAVAATPPYYYPHTQDEVLDHYRRIRDAVDVPLFIYNIPQTVRVKVDLGVAETLIAEGCIRGIKDSQNDLEWFRQLVRFVQQGGYQFALFAGTRQLIDAAVLAGADGAVPSIANAFPALGAGVYEAAAAGRYGEARELEETIIAIESVTRRISLGSRNAAVLALQKAVLANRGIIATPLLTSPLHNLSPEERTLVLEAVERVAPSPTSVR